MNILAIESSSQSGGVALMNDARLIGEYRLDVKTRHAERLMPCIDHLMKQCKLQVSDLDAIAVSIGPGSFTGLRVGMATAKGLATAAELPLIPISTLEIMAASFPYCKARIAPFMDARRGEVYTALFEGESHKLTRFQEDHSVTPEAALEEIKIFQEKESKDILFLGDGALKYRGLIEEKMGGHALFAPKAFQFASASQLAELAIERYLRGDTVLSELSQPSYIRASAAELMRVQKGKK